MYFLALFTAKVVYWLIPLVTKGSGSTWPGHIALFMCRSFVSDILARNPHLHVMLIAGTNGKTTTVKLGTHILEKQGKRVLTNREGANLLNGVASTFIRAMDLRNNIPYDVALLEVDENSLPPVLQQIRNPTVVILLNIFRDQLDRYGEVNSIINKWKDALSLLPSHTAIVMNGDDPLLVSLGDELSAQVLYIGLASGHMKKRTVGHDADIRHCPRCTHPLMYEKVAYAHLGIFHCDNCGFGTKHVIERFEEMPLFLPLLGVYNLYNAYAIILAIHHVYTLLFRDIVATLADFTPAFGRQEKITYHNKQFFIILVKNPAGFNQAIDAITSSEKHAVTVVLLLNDRIPDGRDVSWIWDIDIQPLLQYIKMCVVSGDRAYDMGLRVAYDGCYKPIHTTQDHVELDSNIHIIPSLSKAITYAASHTAKHHNIYVLATYSAMLDVRVLLTGHKLL